MPWPSPTPDAYPNHSNDKGRNYLHRKLDKPPVTNPHTWRAEPIQCPNTDQLLAIVQILDSQD